MHVTGKVTSIRERDQTDKKYNAVKIAYHSGFYISPRKLLFIIGLGQLSGPKDGKDKGWLV